MVVKLEANRAPKRIIECPCGNKFVSGVKIGMCKKCKTRYCSTCAPYAKPMTTEATAATAA